MLTLMPTQLRTAFAFSTVFLSEQRTQHNQDVVRPKQENIPSEPPELFDRTSFAPREPNMGVVKSASESILEENIVPSEEVQVHAGKSNSLFKNLTRLLTRNCQIYI